VRNASLAVENAKLNLRSAQDALDSYQIKAPISGTVTQEEVGMGDTIAQLGSLMVVISDLSALTFDMAIDELDIPDVAVGQTVQITVDALSSRTFTGTVDKININGVSANGVTSYPVTVLVDDPDPALLPGMNVSAEVIVESADHVLAIPMTAVSRGNVVKVVPDDAISAKDGKIDTSKVEERTVTLGVNDRNYVEVIDGLKEGELLLVEGLTAEQQSDTESTQQILRTSVISGGGFVDQ
jgi:HlyD family secretion protein